MITTRPNLRWIDLRDTTSPQTRRRVQWSTVGLWFVAGTINAALWSAFFHLLTR